MKKAILIILLLAMLVYTACKKHTTSFWFTGLQIIDTNGTLVRWVGRPDDDWQINKYTFTAAQDSLFTLNTNGFYSWGQTAPGNVSIAPGSDPVGLDTTQFSYYSFTTSADTNCAVTYVITDENMNVLARGSVFINSGAILSVPVQIPSSYLQAGKVYRLYYAFSAQGSLYFAKGWGDFGVCNETDGYVNSCF